MSRVAKKPIVLPTGVETKIDGRTVSVKGPKGQETITIHKLVQVLLNDGVITTSPREKSIFANALAGTTRALLQNMVLGVTEGFERKLVLVGVGYRAQLKGKQLNLTLGFSHPVHHDIPDGITIEVPAATEIVIKGINKQMVGEVAASIRRYRPPEPYKGKGIRYADEVIILKETKKK